MKALVLPGLNGTRELVEDFVRAAPSTISVRSLPLPDATPQQYRDLATQLHAQIPEGPVVLIAESFSGPLAILLAERCPNVAALVLCASFCEPPKAAWLRFLPAFLWRILPPVFVLRFLLTGGDGDLARALKRSLEGVRREAIAIRILETLRVDVGPALARLSQPVLYLRASHDRVIGARSSARIRALRPATKMADINGPHLLLQTAPTDAWREIDSFLLQSGVRDSQ